MAFKFALLAALCVAQAFAFTSLSEDVTDELTRALADKDLRVVTYCFRVQWHNLIALNEQLPRIAQKVVDGIDEELREAAAEALKRTEKPVTRIGFALINTHSDMSTSLNRLNVVKAFEILVQGVHTIEGIMREIRQELDSVKMEHPELTHAMDWYFRSLGSDMETMIPVIRRTYGECLVRGVVGL